MGGLSARELMRGRTVPREGDFVENCLTNLSGKPTHLRGEGFDEDVEISYDAMDGSDSEEEKEGLYYYNNLEDKFSKCGQAEYTTIVGTKLHGPTFDKSYEEESKEVSPPNNISPPPTKTQSPCPAKLISSLLTASPSPPHGRTRKYLRSYG